MPQSVPTTVIPGVEIARTGTWHASTGTFTFTREHLDAAAAASLDPQLRDPVIKIGHDGVLGDGAPAVGRVANLRTHETADGGYALVGDLVVPEALAEIAPIAYPARSIEGAFHYQTAPTAREYPFVMTGVALLGETLPAIESLNDLYDLFQGKVAASGPTEVITFTREDPTMSNVKASIAIGAVVDQFYDQLSADAPTSWAYVQETWSDFLVVVGTDGELYQVPWTDKGDGLAEFGKPVRVAVQYVPDPDSAEDGPVPGSLAQLSRGTSVLLARGNVAAKKYTEDEKEALYKEGKAMKNSDGTIDFPIADKSDLKNAIRSIGRAKDEDAAKKFIKKRAKALDASDLIPDTWAHGETAPLTISEGAGPSESMSDTAPTSTDVTASAATEETVEASATTETVQAANSTDVISVEAARAAESAGPEVAVALAAMRAAGFETIAAAHLVELQAAAQELADLREARRVEAREAFITEAAARGLIVPAQFDSVRASYDSNEVACRTMVENAVPKLPVAPVGTTASATDADSINQIIERFKAAR